METVEVYLSFKCRCPHCNDKVHGAGNITPVIFKNGQVVTCPSCEKQFKVEAAK